MMIIPRSIIVVILLGLSFNLFSQQPDINVRLISNLDYPQNCNDIWAWVADDGTEYAILGTVTGTAIISLKDPAEPREIAFIPGEQSVWRDMKSWGEYVYVTTDRGADGLLIIHMGGAPDTITWEFWKPELTTNENTDTLKRCHNLYIDENGYCYLAGCNLNSGGPLILDVHTTPGSPVFVGASDPRYSHDVYVREDIMYSSDISSGFFSVIDVSDKAQPVTLAVQPTGSSFTHNAWLSDDGTVLYTTDERPNSYVEAYDVSDFDNIRFLDRIRPLATEGTGVIPHNVHVFEDYLVVSWYTDGLKIIDASRPDNLIEVGSYDTYSQAAGGFNGCWGAYPWLPSGLLLASDINTGLYVFEPEYIRAARLEGLARNAATNANLNDVLVTLQSEQVAYDRTDNLGVFKTGLATGGTYEVTFYKHGFKPKTLEVTLVNGEITYIEVELEPLQSQLFKLSAIDASTGLMIPNVHAQLSDGFGDILLNGDASGFIESQILEGSYELIIGSWGYQYEVRLIVVADQVSELVIELQPGYRDDFVFDYGWEVSGDAVIGHWERGVPEATFFENFIANPDAAYPEALGDKAYVTGLQAGSGPGSFDLDDGYTFLTSPIMDLAGLTNPTIQYARWFFNEGGFSPPNDTMVVYLTNGETEVILEKLWDITNGWILSPAFEINDLIEVNENMQIIFEASDLPGTGHLVEAGVDFFSVIDLPVTSTKEITPDHALRLYPNPARQEVMIEVREGAAGSSGFLQMVDLTGRIVQSIAIPHGSPTYTLQLTDIPPGVYFILLENDQKVMTGKLIVK